METKTKTLINLIQDKQPAIRIHSINTRSLTTLHSKIKPPYNLTYITNGLFEEITIRKPDQSATATISINKEFNDSLITVYEASKNILDFEILHT